MSVGLESSGADPVTWPTTVHYSTTMKKKRKIKFHLSFHNFFFLWLEEETVVSESKVGCRSYSSSSTHSVIMANWESIPFVLSLGARLGENGRQPLLTKLFSPPTTHATHVYSAPFNTPSLIISALLCRAVSSSSPFLFLTLLLTLFFSVVGNSPLKCCNLQTHIPFSLSRLPSISVCHLVNVCQVKKSTRSVTELFLFGPKWWQP